MTRIFYEPFNDGNYKSAPQWKNSKDASTTSIVSLDGRSTVWKVVLDPSVNDRRCELSAPNRPINEIYIFKWLFYVPTNYPASQKGPIVGQVHEGSNMGKLGGPLAAFAIDWNYNDNKPHLIFEINGRQNGRLSGNQFHCDFDLGPVKRGQWITNGIRYYPRTDQGGYAEAYTNGIEGYTSIRMARRWEPSGSQTTAYADSKDNAPLENYFKIGLYSSGYPDGYAPSTTVFYDDYEEFKGGDLAEAGLTGGSSDPDPTPTNS